MLKQAALVTRWPAALLGLILVALAGTLAAATRTETAVHPILVIRVEGVIAPSSADFIISAIKHADREGAQALVIELDTPGGLDL